MALSVKRRLARLWSFAVCVVTDVLRVSSGPVWTAQLFLFALGGYIEWLLIADLIDGVSHAAYGQAPRIAMLIPAICAGVAVGCAASGAARAARARRWRGIMVSRTRRGQGC